MRNQKMFEKMKATVAKAKNGAPSTQKDTENIWKLEGDKAKNGSAIIRFLPGPTEDSDPFFKVYTHGFQGPSGKWFIQDCLTTLGKDCPMCSRNSDLWNSGIEANKEIVRKRKRKTKYYSNILVISDPKNPDNEGKVMIFSFGPKIFDMINEAFNPQDADVEAFNPFDPIEGANFKLKMCEVAGYANFDKSRFGNSSRIGTDEEIEKIMKNLHDLTVYVDPTKFLSPEDMNKKIDYVLGDPRPVRNSTSDEDSDDAGYVARAASSAARPLQRSLPDDDDDDMMAEFEKLAAD